MHVIDQSILEVFFSIFVIVLRGASSLSFLLALFFVFLFIFIVHDNDFDNDLFSLFVFILTHELSLPNKTELPFLILCNCFVLFVQYL